MLALTLEKLAQAPNIEDIDVRIFVDWGIIGRLEDTCTVRDAYLPTAEVFQAKPHIKVQSGTYNILESLRAGYETGKNRIFLIEEDVLINPKTFFEFHWNAHESDNYFVTCGRRHGRMPLDFYSNPGTCYRRESLAQVMPHLCTEYYSGTTSYVDKHFPTMIGMDGSLDDGLIRKVQRSVGGKVLCADPPVAYHCGFHYYSRVHPFRNDEKTVEEKILRVREIFKNIDRASKYTSDFELPEEIGRAL